MRILITLFFCLLVQLPSLSAQNFLGLQSSNYAGVYGIDLQPASIAGSPLKVDISLGGASFTGWNDLVGVYKLPLFSGETTDKLTWNENHADYLKAYYGDSYYGYANAEIHMPLSFMVSVNPRHSFALTSRLRTYFNMDEVGREVGEILFEYDKEPYFDNTYNSNGASLDFASFLEFGGAYAGIPFDNGVHKVKVGGRVKYLIGTLGGYMNLNEVSYTYRSDSLLDINNVQAEYGLSASLSGISDLPDNPDFWDIWRLGDFSGNRGFGADVGVVYEFRPEGWAAKKAATGRKRLDREQTDYLFKAGVSVLDMGFLKFDQAPETGNFSGSAFGLDIQGEFFDFNDSLRAKFTFDPANEKFNVALPAALSFQFDWQAAERFYLNFTPYIAFKSPGNVNKVHGLTHVSLTPRYEGRWLGAALPIGIDQNKDLAVGATFRAGPLILGSNNILSLVTARDFRGADFHAAFRIPIGHGKPSDRDGDGIIDKTDQCPDIPGLVEMNGCPDTDNDGITDADDDCPLEPGAVALGGCPDRDNDGIADRTDACPDDAGLARFNGCPDSDGDGIINANDDCPDESGTLALKGCPDRDEDGIADKSDNCPDLKGDKRYNGCPDSDDDGIIDPDDNCPTEAGPIENGGCPIVILDSDSDGVPNEVDDCPQTAGPASNNGCPELEEEEEVIVQAAFENLEFETGKAVIRKTSYPSLIQLALLMTNRAEAKVRISGHTDDVGAASANLTLSKQRAESVRDYLVTAGVPNDRILVEYFGEEKPLVPNTSAANRQQNRRVEMKIVFD
jgi:outer membrane protein OmpA-like peptidoglycan-associated protein